MASKIEFALLNVVGHVMNFGVVRFKVQVLQQEPHTRGLGVGSGPLQPRQRRIDAILPVGGEVEPGVHNRPLAVHALRQVDIRAQVLVDGVRKEGRELGHVDARQGMQADVDIVLEARRPDGGHALVRPGAQHVGADVRAEVEKVDAVRGGPRQGVLQPVGAGVVADAVLEVHDPSFASASPRPQRPSRFPRGWRWAALPCRRRTGRAGPARRIPPPASRSSR